MEHAFPMLACGVLIDYIEWKVRHSGHFLRAVLIAVAMVTSLSSCHRQESAAAKRFPFTGHIVSIDLQSQSAVVNGDSVPGFMDAMTMSYIIKPGETLRKVAPGDGISGEVVVIEKQGGMPDYWLENVKVTGRAKEPPAAAAGTMHIPAPGEQVPDFAFTNQGGKKISLKQYRGEVLVVTFIYTRCPFPDFCPRMSSNFAEIYKQMGTNPGLAKVNLLSISFDPEHDTPKVLRDYGFSVGKTHDQALFARWQFVVPSAGDLPRIADFFALTVKPEGGLITHNLSTAVIGPDGRIAKWYHGGDWQVSDVIKDATDATGVDGKSPTLKSQTARF